MTASPRRPFKRSLVALTGLALLIPAASAVSGVSAQSAMAAAPTKVSASSTHSGGETDRSPVSRTAKAKAKAHKLARKHHKHKHHKRKHHKHKHHRSHVRARARAASSTTSPTGYPSAATTGVPTGTRLTVKTGWMAVKTPGAVISGIDLRGSISVQAPNVTIKNSIIRVPTNGRAAAGIYSASTGLVVKDVEVTAQTRTWGTTGITGGNFTLLRANLHDLTDPANFGGSNVLIKSSYLHNNAYVTHDPQHNGGNSHDDSIQIVGGSNITIEGNNINGARYGAGVQITQNLSKVSNVVFRNNLAGGGACTINVAEGGAKGGTPLKGVVVQNNRFLHNQSIANCAIIAPRTTIVANQNNVWNDSGALVKASRG
jgi:hypothetical protein